MDIPVLSERDKQLLSLLVGKLSTSRNNNQIHSFSDDKLFTSEVYVAKTTGIGPVVTSIGTAVGGTGSVFSPGSALCDIYQIDPITKRLSLIYNFQKVVYNVSSTTITAGWIIVERDKFGSWLCATLTNSNGGAAGFVDCYCLNCISNAYAVITACASAPTGAANSYYFNAGTWKDYPALGGSQIVTWVSGCIWKSSLIGITDVGYLGTGTGSTGYYQWIHTIAGTNGVNSTTTLTYISGYNILGI